MHNWITLKICIYTMSLVIASTHPYKTSRILRTPVEYLSDTSMVDFLFNIIYIEYLWLVYLYVWETNLIIFCLVQLEVSEQCLIQIKETEYSFSVNMFDRKSNCMSSYEAAICIETGYVYLIQTLSQSSYSH